MKSHTKFSTVALAMALSLASACSDKKAFSGGTTTGSAEKAADAEPEVEETTSDPEPVADETDNIFKECDSSKTHIFPADLYELPRFTKKLPDFSSISSIKKICLNQIDITTREFDEGFPGVDNLKEWFALNFNFSLKVEEAGEYQFIVNSDDGSKLFIDGELVINHDGQHSPSVKKGTIKLTEGEHKVNLQYFQGPANQIALELKWVPPGGSSSYIPVANITAN